MEYLISIVTILVGFFALTKGADWVVEGASGLAKRLRVSDLLIGLTIVAFGTSLPELVVNIFSSSKGAGDISIGNVVGSNLFNTAVVIGFSTLISKAKIEVQSSTIRKEIPLSFLAIVVLFVLGNDKLFGGNEFLLSRNDGVILLLFFTIFMSYILDMAIKDREFLQYEVPKEASLLKEIGMLLIGLVLLSFGGDWTVNGAVKLATLLGVSQKLIGLTIVAAGTSLPELATSLVAAKKGKNDIAVGNVVGSNIFNIFFILGISFVIKPYNFEPLLNVDLLVLTFITIILFTGSLDKKVTKREGILLLLTYLVYLIYIILRK